jgi:predicted nucleic acid-binding Zn ribbon protein
MRRNNQPDDGEDEDHDWDEADSDHDDADEDDNEEPTIVCPNCRRQIHEDSQRCPYCEQYITEEDRERSSQPWWIILGAILALGMVFSWFVF